MIKIVFYNHTPIWMNIRWLKIEIVISVYAFNPIIHPISIPVFKIIILFESPCWTIFFSRKWHFRNIKMNLLSKKCSIKKLWIFCETTDFFFTFSLLEFFLHLQTNFMLKTIDSIFEMLNFASEFFLSRNFAYNQCNNVLKLGGVFATPCEECEIFQRFGWLGLKKTKNIPSQNLDSRNISFVHSKWVKSATFRNTISEVMEGGVRKSLLRINIVSAWLQTYLAR